MVNHKTTSKMKKTMKTMLAFVAGAVLLAGCAKEEINEIIPEFVTLTACQEGSTKATIDAETSTQIDWTSNDKINYFGAATGQYMTLSEGEGTKSGTFGGMVSQGTDDYVLYPYNAEATCTSGTITTTIPSTQSVPAGTFDPAAALMVGKVNGTNVQFYNAVAFIAITIPSGSNNITKMVITGNNNERLSGKVTISNIATDAAPSIAGTQRTWAADGASVISDGVKYVEVTPNGTSTFKAGSTYYVAVAPDATLSKGIYVLLYNGSKTDAANLKLAVKKSSNSLALARAIVKKVGLPAISSGDWKSVIALTGCYMAPFNLGATKSVNDDGADAYGNYYSWGEVDAKEAYSKSAYKGSADLSGLTDAATCNWGPDWRLGTKDEWENSITNTKFPSMPKAGRYKSGGLSGNTSSSYYWTSTYSDATNAYEFFRDNNNKKMNTRDRNDASSVRPFLAL